MAACPAEDNAAPCGRRMVAQPSLLLPLQVKATKDRPHLIHLRRRYRTQLAWILCCTSWASARQRARSRIRHRPNAVPVYPLPDNSSSQNKTRLTWASHFASAKHSQSMFSRKPLASCFAFMKLRIYKTKGPADDSTLQPNR